MEKGDVEKARTYIEHMIMGKDYVQLSDYKENTGNSIVDMLLHYKVNLMKKYGITLESHIEIPDDVDVDDTDLCVIVGNSLDNAIEAVKGLQKKEMKIISCDIIYRKGALVIRIENMYDGERKKDSKGNYISTKKDDANHGIGLYSVKKIVEKYNGLLTICEDENRFLVQIFMYTTQAKGKSYE